MSRKSYAELDAQIAALLKQKQEMAQESADALAKAIVGNKTAVAALSELTTRERQGVARWIASNMEMIVGKVKAATPQQPTEVPAENVAPVVPTMPPTVAGAPV